MRLLLGLAAVGLVLTLLAGALTASRRPSAPLDGEVPRHRPNVLFWFAGSIIAIVGVVLIVVGIIAIGEVEGQFQGRGPQETADATSLVTWGVVVMVNGVYVWRGARRRGWHDRVGRLLIIAGYLVLGITMSSTVHSAVDLWATSTEQASRDVLSRTMLTFLGWGVPAAALVWLGVRLAHEKVLLTAQADASY